MKEKLEKIFKGKRKLENLIVLLVLMIIVVIAINYIWNDDKKEDTHQKMQEERTNEIIQVSTNSNEDNLENKLENILSKIAGVGKVRVMLTYSESSTLVPVYDENTKSSNTIENDDMGGTRTTTQTDNQKQVIYKENIDGSKEPVTQSVLKPKIEGAIIAAEGANNSTIKSDIVQAVEAATGLGTHKIQVFEMKE